jgi:hypothetical protein
VSILNPQRNNSDHRLHRPWGKLANAQTEEDEMNWTYKRKFAAIIHCATLILLGTASAAERLGNGNELYDLCQRGDGFYKLLVAWYTIGLTDQAFYMGAALGYCPPAPLANVTIEQTVDIFCSYLKNTPQERHLPAPRLFHQAMQAAWPCK